MDSYDINAQFIAKLVKTLDNFLWRITNNVVCTVCHEIFTDPMTVPCNHNFCSNCVQKVHSGLNSAKSSCPLCRQHVNRRYTYNNHVLREISQLCLRLPDAFKEDVVSLSSDLKELSEELTRSSRTFDFSLNNDKGKEKNMGNQKRNRRRGKKNGNNSMFSSVVTSAKDEDTNSRNDESVLMKSASQIETQSHEFIAEPAKMERKLRAVEDIESKQKVNNWLETVDREPVLSCSFSADKWGSQDDSIIPGTEDKSVRKFVKPIIIGDPVESLVTCKNNVNGTESDPYEFIASQRSQSGRKRKKRDRARKKTVPEFEAIQNFTKTTFKKNNLNKTDLFDDVCNDNLAKVNKTYSRKTDKTITIGESTNEVVLKDPGKNKSETDDSEIISPTRRPLPILSDSDDSDQNVIKMIKKPRLDTIVLSDCGAPIKKPEEDDKTKTLNTVQLQSQCSQSANWPGDSTSQMDFDMSEKSLEPSRVNLDVTEGEPSSSNSKKSLTQRPSEDEILNNDVQMKDLSQNSEHLVGFEQVGSAEKKKAFKVMVEKMEEDLYRESLKSSEVNCKGSVKKNFKTANDGAIPSTSKDTVVESPKNKVIPFTLLGKIKKTEKSSIVFLKIGRLLPIFKRARPTVVKLMFPKTNPKNVKKVKEVAVGTETDAITQSKKNESSETVNRETSTMEEHNKVNAEIQTKDSFLQSDSKEVQTSPRIQADNKTAEQGRDDKSSLVQPEFVWDSELESQFNRSWISEERKLSQSVRPLSVNQKKQDKLVIPNEGTLMQRVVDNINLDLARARAVSQEPSKQPNEIEDSDSDVFIEQTPPRSKSKNGSAVLITPEVHPNAKAGTSHFEESFKTANGSLNKTPEILNTLNTNKPSSQQKEGEVVAKSDQRENNENDPNELNVGSDRKTPNDVYLADRKVCIASSGVKCRENILKFAEMFQVEYLNTPRKDMTHLVVGLHENEGDDSVAVPLCTPKLVYALANKKWIVTEAWVEACLKAKAIVPEEPYESVDPNGGDGCSVARQSTESLMKNCEVYLLGVYRDISKHEFMNLVADSGATVVKKLHHFTYTPGRIRMILIDSMDVVDWDKIRVFMRTHRTLVMSREVFVMCLIHNKFVNFSPYIVERLPLEEMVKWGYPLDLVKLDPENENDSQ